MADISLQTPAAGATGDAEILAAWERRKAAFERWQSLPFSGEDSDMSPEQEECWEIIDSAEEVIRGAVAESPRGVEIQVWTALCHIVRGTTMEGAALTRRDLAYFEAHDEEADYNVRMTLAALRSLRTMGA
jgi:hypothetical protein